MKINETEWYPIYLTPTPEEIAELAASQWDTIRILSLDTTQRNNTIPTNQTSICIASGYGNTHETLARALRNHFKVKSVWSTPMILYYIRDGNNKVARFNMGDCGGSDSVRPSVAFRRFLTEYETDILKTLIEASGISLI